MLQLELRSTTTKNERVIVRTAADDSATLATYFMGSMPDDMTGTADAVVLFRALHNLARNEQHGPYLSPGWSRSLMLISVEPRYSKPASFIASMTNDFFK